MEPPNPMMDCLLSATLTVTRSWAVRKNRFKHPAATAIKNLKRGDFIFVECISVSKNNQMYLKYSQDWIFVKFDG